MYNLASKETIKSVISDVYSMGCPSESLIAVGGTALVIRSIIAQTETIEFNVPTEWMTSTGGWLSQMKSYTAVNNAHGVHHHYEFMWKGYRYKVYPWHVDVPYPDSHDGCRVEPLRSTRDRYLGRENRKLIVDKLQELMDQPAAARVTLKRLSDEETLTTWRPYMKLYPGPTPKSPNHYTVDRVYGILQHGKPVGVIVLRYYEINENEDGMEIEWLWIEPSVRKEGIATIALQQLVNSPPRYTRSIPITKVTVETLADNEAAVALYQSVGFTPHVVSFSYTVKSNGEDE